MSSQTSNRDRLTRPAGAPPGPRQRELRLSDLLDAASTLFVEKGLSHTSIEEIADRAGVAKGTFYHYFHDRTAMLEALRIRYLNCFADAVEIAIGSCSSDDWESKLSAWTIATENQYLASYALHDAIFHDIEVRQRCVISDEAFVKILAELLRTGTEAGAWSVAEPTIAAAFLFYGLHGLLDEAIAGGEATASISANVTALFKKLVSS